jgi:hypothetical protein
MPAPNLGLVGAMGVGALQRDIQRMEAERRAAEQLAYKRQQDEKDAAELSRHRQALEDYQRRNLTVNELEAKNRADALAAASNKQPARNILRMQAPGTTPDDKNVYDVARYEDTGEEIWRHVAPAKAEPRPENLTPLESYLKQANEEHVKATGAPMNAAQVKAATREYNLETTRAPQAMGSQVVVPVQQPDGSVTYELRSGSIGAKAPDPAEQRNRYAAAKRADIVIDSIGELSERINVNEGALATIKGATEQAKAKINLSDDVAEYEAVVATFVPLLARAVGHTGVLTQLDVDSVKQMLPSPRNSKALRDRKMERIRLLMAGMNPTGEPDPSDQKDPIGGGGLSAPISVGGGGGRGVGPPAGGGAAASPPRNPKVGQTWKHPNGQTATWDGTAWVF